MRSPSTYGQSSTPLRCPGICSGSSSVSNATYFARDVGSKPREQRRRAGSRATGSPSTTPRRSAAGRRAPRAGEPRGASSSVERAGLRDLALDRDRPRPRRGASRAFARRVVLVGAELVEVVVAGGVLARGDRVGARLLGRRSGGVVARAAGRDQGCAAEQELAAAEVERAIGDLDAARRVRARGVIQRLMRSPVSSFDVGP